MIEVGGLLGASVAVFGSPKNRLKGKLTSSEANELAAEFLSQLIPCLEENKVTLTLEPNAPEYGADFLVNYEDVVALSNLIDSESIRPQIDTGCLWMVGVESHEAFKFMKPKHIHLSTPFLGPVPGERKFDDLLTVVKSVDYKGWLVIETLESAENNFEKIIDSAKWLANWEQS
jgi:sugar phosphate isomerase/epimerase